MIYKTLEFFYNGRLYKMVFGTAERMIYWLRRLGLKLGASPYAAGSTAWMV